MKTKMLLAPTSKWVQVSLDFDETEKVHEKSLIALPEDYKPAEKPYKAVSVVCDSQKEYIYGDVIIVPTHLIREIGLRERTFYLVERSHIMAVVSAEERGEK